MICPLGGPDCAECPYWPHCKTGVREMWNTYPERWRSFQALIEGRERWQVMTGILAEALRRSAAHERHEANLWRRALRWHSFGGVRWPEEYEARAEIYDDWATALELDVHVDFVRYGCERSSLGDSP
jgi:hypothetical protein